VQFPAGNQIGYAVGQWGTVLKSTDGGMSWSPVTPVPTGGVRLNACWFLDNNTGFVVGLNAIMSKTIDGGLNWTPVAGLPAAVVAANLEIKDIQFATPMVAYASGADGMVLQSTDGGDNWTQIRSGPGEMVFALDFPEGPTFGYYGRSGGRLGKTDDGGATWTEQAMGATWFQGVDFLTASVGYAVGGGGTIARRSSVARVVTDYARDSAGRQIAAHMYDASLGDTPATYGANSDGGVQSQASFDQWFRDVLGVNISAPLSIRLTLQADGTYVFNSAVDQPHATLGGFFPIENLLFGNPGTYTPDRNFHFTFHGRWQFVYDDTASQFFSFSGDDDVFVYINGQLVIDIGGRHMPVEQFVDMGRLGLTDGESYDLDFFYAERHCCGSNMRMTTNMPLLTAWVPTVSSASD
jgi:fibro-slime domain-containing protein